MTQPLHTLSSRALPPIERDLLREAFGCFATGVAVVTGRMPDGASVGLTISSFNTASMSPPLVLWSLSLASPSRDAFAPGRIFAVNVLGREQEALCRHFARPSEDKFRGVAAEEGIGGVPLLTGSVARFQCLCEHAQIAGDHELYIGRVLAVEAARNVPPLIFHQSRFAELSKDDAA